MRVLSPGKLVLTGAYAVLEGAPAIVAAVDRYAVVAIAAPACIDTGALHDEQGRKLGLGSSAASMVAAEAALAVARGQRLGDADVRAALFRTVREAHARSQGGGSGVDVAAAIHGGVLRYELSGAEACLRAVELPAGLAFAAFWSGASARTSDLRARVALAEAPRRRALAVLHAASLEAASAVDAGDRERFVRAARAFGLGLEGLGRAADAPIVPAAFAELGARAEREHAAFHPSGAGGGDVAVWLGSAPPSPAFLARADALSMRRLDLGFDRGGVRLESPSS